MSLEWLIEMKHIVFSLLKNPTLYWIFLLSYFILRQRQAREIAQFNSKLSGIFAEWKKTCWISILFSLLISLLALTFGLLITYEVVLILCIVTILISYVYHLKLLSASFTIGFTYLLLFKSIQNHYENSIVILTSLTILIGLLLLFEALMLRNYKNNDSFPALGITNRGATFGYFHIKKISFIPLLIFVPSGPYTAFFPILPEISVYGETYNIIILPLFIGFHFLTKHYLPNELAKRSAKQIGALGMLIILLSIVAYYYPSLSILVVIIAMIGRGIIQVTADKWPNKASLHFVNTAPGVKVLSILPNSPAQRIGLEIGDTILRINGQTIHNVDEFYALLNEKDILYSLEIIGIDNLPKTLLVPIVTPHRSELKLILL